MSKTCYCDEGTEYEELCQNCKKYLAQNEYEHLQDYIRYAGKDENGNTIDVRDIN